MSNNKVYNDLIDHLRNWIFGLPESKYLLPLFELRFTPEEAEFPKDPRKQSSRFLRERGYDPLEIFKKNS